MYFVSFAAVFPEIGTSETRVIYTFDNPEVPDGAYAFLECYCEDPECDCQLVRFIVMDQNGQLHASISYGWNSKAFYDEAFSACDHNFPGPDFAVLQPQGSYAKFFLEFCKNFLVRDETYVGRLKRHNALFKKEAKKRDLSKPLPVRESRLPGRNDPCLCGSGQKYKKCCY